MTTNVKIPVGGNNPLPETEEAKAARLATEEADRLAKEEADKKAAEEKAEADRLAAEAEAKRLADENKGKPNESKINIQLEDGSTVEYNLDKDGNAVDKDGKVVYTADQLKDVDDNNDNTGGATIEDISKISGVQVLDEKGNPKTYENTVEGFAQREVDIKQLGYAEGINKAMAEFFTANPEFESMYKYKRTYGTLQNYSEFVDYSKVTLAKDNEQQLIDVIVKAELAKGASLERATKLANFSKADNTLLADAEDSLKFLAKVQEKDIKAAERAEQDAIAKATQDEYNYYGIGYDKNGKEVVLNVDGSIYDMVVNKGIIGKVMIPKDGLTIKDQSGTIKHLSRRQVFDYIYAPVAEIGGELYSQAQIDEYKRLSSKEELVSSYIRNLLGGNVSQLVEVSKRQDNANEIRTIKLKSKESARASGGGNSKKVIIPIN